MMRLKESRYAYDLFMLIKYTLKALYKHISKESNVASAYINFYENPSWRTISDLRRIMMKVHKKRDLYDEQFDIVYAHIYESMMKNDKNMIRSILDKLYTISLKRGIVVVI